MASKISSPNFSRYDVRVIIKFSIHLGKSQTETHADLNTVMGENSPSVQTVRKWYREIGNGREDMTDLEHNGHKGSVVSESTIQTVKLAVEEDKRRTCRDLEEIVGIPKSTVHRILTEHLEKKKVFSKWVPHILTPQQKDARIAMARGFLDRFEREGDRFLGRIITGDETWVYSFDPELKRQSMQWVDPNEPRPEKARRKQGAKKVMHIVFFDVNGVVLNHAVPTGVTVNADYYKDVLQTKLRPAIRKKRPETLAQGVILHHDNAPVHKARAVTELIDRYSWELLDHAPYSPDLAPCDFHLFPKVKENLRGQRFEDEDAIEEAMKTSLLDVAKGSMVTAFQAWLHRLQKCIDTKGCYVE